MDACGALRAAMTTGVWRKGGGGGGGGGGEALHYTWRQHQEATQR